MSVDTPPILIVPIFVPDVYNLVKDVFASFGYEEHVKFDSMESRYVFPWNNIQHTSN